MYPGPRMGHVPADSSNRPGFPGDTIPGFLRILSLELIILLLPALDRQA